MTLLAKSEKYQLDLWRRMPIGSAEVIIVSLLKKTGFRPGLEPSNRLINSSSWLQDTIRSLAQAGGRIECLTTAFSAKTSIGFTPSMACRWMLYVVFDRITSTLLYHINLMGHILTLETLRLMSLLLRAMWSARSLDKR